MFLIPWDAHTQTFPPSLSQPHFQRYCQVVRELKATSYAPRVAILGSREQFCVHPTVKQFTGTIQNRKCSNLTADHSCQYKNNLASYHSQNVGVNAGVMDIEDLLAVGKRDTVSRHAA